MFYDNQTVVNKINDTIVEDDKIQIIGATEGRVNNKEYFVYMHRFENVANDGTVTISMRAITKAMHLVVTTYVEGKVIMKSFHGSTFTDDGTAGNIFNRFIDNAPSPTGQIYQGGTVDVLGSARFDVMIPAGSGPQSSGNIAIDGSQSVLEVGEELTIQWTNVAGQVRDIGVAIEWYEL